MDDLYTTKQVQEILQVDRTTIYRMLKDGRLAGVKIGKHWRFPQEEVQALLAGRTSSPAESSDKPISADVLPLYCVRTIQEVFAELAEIGAVTTEMDGTPLTEISNSCQFCNLIYGSEKGKEACINSWRNLAQLATKRTPFVTCHAGLQYARDRIEINHEAKAMFFAGQFYINQPDPSEEKRRLKRLATSYELDFNELAEAIKDVPVLDARKRAEIGIWLEKVAGTFEHVGEERAALIDRLQRIASITSLS